MIPSIPTRSPETEDRYLRRAVLFEAHVAKKLGRTSVSPQQTVSYAISRRSEWATSTWRQVKAALCFRYGAMNTTDSRAAVALLTSQPRREAGREVGNKKTFRTSAQRSKQSTLQSFDKLMQSLEGGKSSTSSFLRLWLVFGAVTGLRPHEWGKAEIVLLSEADLVGKGDAAVKTPYLRVENAKHTNGRAHGRYRHLNLSALPESALLEMADFLLQMSVLHASGDYRRTYERTRKMLYRLNKSNLGLGKKNFNLYTVRHMFAANAKQSFTQKEVSALLGHSSDITAERHYGRRQWATGGSLVSPLRSEANKVRSSSRPEALRQKKIKDV